MSVSGFWGPEKSQVAGSPLTIWTRPHEQVRKTKPSASESGFLLSNSADLGSRLVGQPSQKYVFTAIKCCAKSHYIYRAHPVNMI